MEKWLILLSVFKNFLKTEIENTWWSWATEISLLIFKLISVGTILFALWSIYSYLRGYEAEALAAIQTSGILLAIILSAILLFLLVKKIIKKYAKTKINNVYGELFDLSNDLYKDFEKIKNVGKTVFQKNPVLVSSAVLGSAYFLYALLRRDQKAENIQQSKS